MEDMIRNIFNDHKNMSSDVDVFGEYHDSGPVSVVYTNHKVFLHREGGSPYWYYLDISEEWDGTIRNISLFREEWDGYRNMPWETKYIQIDSVEDWKNAWSFAENFLRVKRESKKEIE